jgi:hypothetical protein
VLRLGRPHGRLEQKIDAAANGIADLLVLQIRRPSADRL